MICINTNNQCPMICLRVYSLLLKIPFLLLLVAFNSNFYLPISWSNTTLILIPKKQNSQNITHLDLLYFVISFLKSLPKKIKPLFNHLTYNEQNVFDIIIFMIILSLSMNLSITLKL